MEQLNLPIDQAPKAVVVLSGGQDSTTCLFAMVAAGYEVHAVTFNYNQRHAIELDAARRVARMAGVASHEVINLGPVLLGTSPLVNDGQVLEQYKDHHSLPGGIEKTFVPMRNQLFLTIAANRAFVLGATVLVTGVCEEDYGGYPDCRRVFIDSLEDAINCSQGIASGDPAWLEIMTPLMNLTKKETVEMALNIRGCYEALAFTHTSYDGKYPPTGRDHATLLRAKGFEEAGVPDPLIIRAAMDKLMELPVTTNYQDIGSFIKRVAAVHYE